MTNTEYIVGTFAFHIKLTVNRNATIKNITLVILQRIVVNCELISQLF